MHSLYSPFDESFTWGNLSKIEKGDVILSYVALSQIVLGLIQFLLISYGMDQDASTIYRIIMSAGAFLISLPILLKRNFCSFIISYLVLLLLYVIHVIVFPNTISIWHEEGMRFLVPICIPTALCIYNIYRKQIFYQSLKSVSYISAAIGLLLGYKIFSGSFILVSYSMGFGYFLLLPMLVLFYQRKWYSISVSLLLLILIIVFGSRGPLLSVGIFLLYMLVQKKAWKLLAVLLLVGIICFAGLDSYLQSLDISSRTIDMILSGDFTEETNRDLIAEKAILTIKDNPIIGYGMFGDRIPVGDHCHNIILEVICDFGVIIGSIFLIIFVYQLLKYFLRLKGGDKDIYVMLVTFSVVPLLMSGSYLTSPQFALFIGFLLLIKKRDKVVPY